MKKGTILPVLLSLVLLASCGEKGEISSTVTDSGSASESVSSAFGADEIWRVDDCPTEFAIGVPFHIADYLETDPPGAPLSYQPLTPNVTIDGEGNCTLISAGDFAIRVTSGSAVRRFEGKAVSQELLEAKAILSSIKNQYQCAGLMIDMETGQYGYLDLTVHDKDYYWSLAIGGGLLRSKAGHTYQYEIEAVEGGAAGEAYGVDLRRTAFLPAIDLLRASAESEDSGRYFYCAPRSSHSLFSFPDGCDPILPGQQGKSRPSDGTYRRAGKPVPSAGDRFHQTLPQRGDGEKTQRHGEELNQRNAVFSGHPPETASAR